MTRRGLLVLAALAVTGCSIRDAACGTPRPAESAAGPGVPEAAARPPSIADTGLRVAILGDSLTAGFGLLSEQAYPAELQRLFEGEGYHEVEIVNAGVSGDTTAGGLRRVADLLEPGVRILVIGLGGNDALRGLTTRETHDNLAETIRIARTKGVSVVLCGMEAPTNLGEDYRTAFREIYLQLVREHEGAIGFVPFLLEGVAGNPSLNQADGIHPNADGARAIAQAIYPKLRTLVDSFVGGGG